MAAPLRSSSTLALWFLPLVTVLSASGAQAQFNITNVCNRTIAIANAASNYSVESGTTTTVPVSPAAFFKDPLNISVPSSMPVPVPTQIVSFLNSLFGLQSIVVSCSGTCITLIAGFNVMTQMTIPLGPFCLPMLPQVPAMPPPPSQPT